RGDLSAVDQPAAGLEDAAVDRVGEMLGAQELGDPFIGPVVDQHRADQRLFGLEVVRRLAMRERLGAGEQGDAGLGFWHDWRTVGRRMRIELNDNRYFRAGRSATGWPRELRG